MNQLWRDASGRFFVPGADGSPNSTGGYLVASNRRSDRFIYYVLAGVLNNYVRPGEDNDPFPLSVYRSGNDNRPTRVQVRVSFCKE